MVSRNIIVAVAIIVIVAVGGGLYYFSSQTPASPTKTPETKPTTPEVKQETTESKKETPTTPETNKETPTAVLDGESLYNENCKPCHGAKGVGTDTAPAVSASNADRSILENGEVEHPSFKDILTPDEITAIMDYLTS